MWGDYLCYFRTLPGHLKWPDAPKKGLVFTKKKWKNAIFCHFLRKCVVFSFLLLFRCPQSVLLKAETFPHRIKCVRDNSDHFRQLSGHLNSARCLKNGLFGAILANFWQKNTVFLRKCVVFSFLLIPSKAKRPKGAPTNPPWRVMRWATSLPVANRAGTCFNKWAQN